MRHNPPFGIHHDQLDRFEAAARARRLLRKALDLGERLRAT
jgi:hypothetical protein